MSPSPRIGEREGVRGCERSGFAISTARNEPKTDERLVPQITLTLTLSPRTGRGKHLPINLAVLPVGGAELPVASSVTQYKYAGTHFDVRFENGFRITSACAGPE